MVKTILFVRRRADLTHEQFRDYYESRHAPLAASVLPWLQRYTRNYFAPVAGRDWPYDVATEFWFATEDDRQATRAFSLSDAGQILAQDEERFMDRASMTAFAVDEQETRLPASAGATVEGTAPPSR
jgi:uncharacterized protein (TIGR02118 family)